MKSISWVHKTAPWVRAVPRMMLSASVVPILLIAWQRSRPLWQPIQRFCPAALRQQIVNLGLHRTSASLHDRPLVAPGFSVCCQPTRAALPSRFVFFRPWLCLQLLSLRLAAGTLPLARLLLPTSTGAFSCTYGEAYSTPGQGVALSPCPDAFQNARPYRFRDAIVTCTSGEPLPIPWYKKPLRSSPPR